MRVDQVVEVLDALDSAAVRHWVAGGWGVDALVGAITRPHRDLDLAVDANSFDGCMATLGGLGYRVETDWLPLRVEVAAHVERWVDVHPSRSTHRVMESKGIRQAHTSAIHAQAFTQGRIGNRAVPCLSVSQQLAFHSGYELRPQNEHDLRELQRLQPRA